MAVDQDPRGEGREVIDSNNFNRFSDCVAGFIAVVVPTLATGDPE